MPHNKHNNIEHNGNEKYNEKDNGNGMFLQPVDFFDVS